jgi:hypothetical protein
LALAMAAPTHIPREPIGSYCLCSETRSTRPAEALTAHHFFLLLSKGLFAKNCKLCGFFRTHETCWRVSPVWSSSVWPIDAPFWFSRHAGSFSTQVTTECVRRVSQ